MLVEIHGAGFKNKGAQLMLQTAVKKITAEFPSCTCCIAAGGNRPPAEVAKLGLKFIWPSNVLYAREGKFWPLFQGTKMLASVVPQTSLSPYGLVKRSQVDALVDISGFAFSDMWGPALIRNFLTIAKYYSGRDKPVFMLPQMFGPLDDSGNRHLFEKMTSYCMKIYARDSLSFEVARNYASKKTAVAQAPDITLFQEESHEIRQPKTDVIFVPNIRVLDKNTDWDETEYVRIFVETGKQIVSSGRGVQILVHETFGKDAELAEKIRLQLGLEKSSIFANEDPHALKAKIASGWFLFGSRFHSLAGALSTATPVISIGWAHKYGQLLADFGVEKFDIKSKQDSSRVSSLTDQLLNREEHSKLVAQLKKSKQELRVKNHEMWQDVFKMLSNTKNLR